MMYAQVENINTQKRKYHGSFEFQPIQKNGYKPVWNGTEFQIGSQFTKILQYSSNDAGWNEDLTKFHESMDADQSFIDKASREYTIEQIKKNIKTKDAVILEIGCSSGTMLKQMKQEFPESVVMGADVIYKPLEILSNALKDVPLFQFDILACPLPNNCVDAVILLNVLEHLEDDSKALQQIYRILKPGGIAILEVPANPNLYDVYDKYMMHYRRYALSQLVSLVQTHQFQVIKKSHLGVFCFPGFWLVKKRNQKCSFQSDSHEHTQVQTQISNVKDSKILNLLMRLELSLGKHINYPFGIRCLVTCKK